MKPALKAAAFLILLFAIPIVPFLWLGESFEQSLLEALRQPRSPGVVSAWVIGLLAADMFLPVPSSAVITYAGGILGIVWGTLVAWVGLSVGAVGGFWLARRFGEPLARWFSDADDVARMGGLCSPARTGCDLSDARPADPGRSQHLDAGSRSPGMEPIPGANVHQ
jgi:uncharacterized membrane protein YdjX (TVP38/TMEM64 family)